MYKMTHLRHSSCMVLALLLTEPEPTDAAAKVFGAGETMSLSAVSWALVAIIIFTILYDFATEALEHRLEDTPYIKIVNQVYKELTVMGIISFSIFMMHQTGDILTGNPVAFLAFEYAHMLIFFIALMIILTAVYLCILNVMAREQYLKTDMMTIEDLLESHEEMGPFQRFCYNTWWIPSTMRTDFEFKLMHSFFIDAYMVPPSFEFGMYLCESLDMQIVELVEVDKQSWFVMILGILANLLRAEVSQTLTLFQGDEEEEEDGNGNENGGAELVVDEDAEGNGRLLFSNFVHRLLGGSGDSMGCDVTSTSIGTDSRRGLAGVENGCTPKTDTVYTFIIFGFALAIFSFVIFWQARKSFMNLLSKTGCHCIEDYRTRLDVLNRTFNPRFIQAKKALINRKSMKNVFVKMGSKESRRGRNDNKVTDENVEAAKRAEEVRLY